MKAVWFSQWRKERRAPVLLLLFIALSVLAVVLFGLNTDGRLKVGVFAGEGTSAEEMSDWMTLLNEDSAFEFVVREEGLVREEVGTGRAMGAVMLLPDDYRVVAAVDDPNVRLIERHVQSVFAKELGLRAAAASSADPAAFARTVQDALTDPPLTLSVTTPDGNPLIDYDMGLHLLFGFSMFLALFTIGFKVSAINREKTAGIWSRMILSPTRKTGVYLGHLLYASAIGFGQMLVVYLVFLFGFDFPLGERFGGLLLVTALYAVSAVALAMLFTGLTRTPEQFNMVYPTVIPMMPLIAGAYMPPGTISSPALQFAAEFVPLTHALEAFMGLTMYGVGWSELALPLAKLLLITVVCMGVGVNLVERGRN